MNLGNLFSSGSFNDLLDRKPAKIKTQTYSGNSGVASLQQSGVADINSIKLPSWMSTNPDQNLGELLQSYAGVGAAFDPTGQVQARNDAIGYNTSAGGQAANNAATEYANRAAQSGGSSLGAGVVKAQAMLPVMQQNAALKTDAADVAAKSHQQAVSLSSQIASTIGQLRNSYLQSITGYATDQQRMQLQSGQFNAGMALDQQKFNYQREQDQRQQSLMAASSGQLASTQKKAPGAYSGYMGLQPTMAQFQPSQQYQAYQQLNGLL